LEKNTLVDGFFHLSTWTFVAVGMTLTVQAWREGRLAPPWRAHIGLLLAGWGIFNLVEGIIDHEILGIHHVRDDLGGPIGWDLGFLAFGLVLVLVGVMLSRNAERDAPAPGKRSARRELVGAQRGARRPREAVEPVHQAKLALSVLPWCVMTALG
jgi:uncharacterized membrane protein